MSAGDDNSEAPTENPYLDAANRLERVIDLQIEGINGIDDKAEHITRLIGTLLGIVLSVLALATRFDGANGGLGNVSTPTAIAFSVGIATLIIAMAAAIRTYVSSRFPIGLRAETADELIEAEYPVHPDAHYMGLINVYGDIIIRNRTVVDVNAQRFVQSLYFLLIGTINLSVAAVIYLGPLSGTAAWVVLVFDAGICAAAGWYTFTGRYLALEDERSDEDEADGSNQVGHSNEETNE